MSILNRFIPLLISVALYGMLQQLFRRPELIYYFAAVGSVLIFVGVWQLMDRKFTREKLWRFFIVPFLLFLSGLSFFAFLSSGISQQLFLAALCFMVWVYFEVLTIRFHFRTRYQAHSLENISTHLNLVVVFLTAASLYSVMIHLGFPLWQSLAIMTAVLLLLNYELILTVGVTFKGGKPFIFVISLICLEIFWMASYLPTSIYVNSLMVMVGYYLTAGLCRNWLMEIWNRTVIKRYVIISLATVLIALLSAKYF